MRSWKNKELETVKIANSYRYNGLKREENVWYLEKDIEQKGGSF